MPFGGTVTTFTPPETTASLSRLDRKRNNSVVHPQGSFQGYSAFSRANAPGPAMSVNLMAASWRRQKGAVHHRAGVWPTKFAPSSVLPVPLYFAACG